MSELLNYKIKFMANSTLDLIPNDQIKIQGLIKSSRKNYGAYHEIASINHQFSHFKLELKIIVLYKYVEPYNYKEIPLLCLS